MSHLDGPANRLAGESSPYLLLHAKNPVDWYPWGEEAFARARREDKPIFLSVGYSTCYWCHVMERESFSDPGLAALLNEGFVSVKLDREERPDLDEIYMLATQLLTQQGGWPNSVFLTHDLEPFYAGTYFPPEDRWGRPGFPRLLKVIREAWKDSRQELVEQARGLAAAIRRHLSDAPGGGSLPEPGVAEAVQLALARRFDAQWGGFGGAPKFPSPANLFFLLDRAGHDREARNMLEVTLDRMARGGLMDQLAGGFHRYSTDEQWLVPHFEKMLYDNASLGRLYAEAGARFGRADFERVARQTFDFVLAELTGPQGGFLSAIDAETGGHEGAYYVWSPEELERELDPAARELLGAVYGFEGRPTFEGREHVLHLPRPWDEQAARLGLGEAELRRRAEPGRLALLAARARRERPLTDDKVLADWNGLTIAGLAVAGRRLGEPRYLEAARRAAGFALTELRDASGELLHAWRAGRAHVAAMLDDYAFLVHGLLALEAATGEARWLEEAGRLAREQDEALWDPRGGWFQAAPHPHLLVRSKAATDGALPAGNGVAVLNLLALAERTGDGGYRQQAEQALRGLGGALEQLPLAHVTLARAAARLGPAEGGGGLPEAADADDVVGLQVRHAQDGWLALELSIAGGWHLNANPAGTGLAPTLVEGPDVLRVEYPPAQAWRPAPEAEELPVYTGRVELRVELRPGAGPEPRLVLTYQPCDHSRCLAPVRRRVRPARREG